MLLQALEDARLGSGRRRSDALNWLTDDADRQFSFRFCCRLLRRKPERLREWVTHTEPAPTPWEQAFPSVLAAPPL